jgi:DNA-binding NtrC family response regulator
MLPDSLAPAKVLIVEDDADVRLAREEALQLAGIEVLAAASAERAKTMLEPHFSGVVVTTMRLAGMDGLQVLQFARGLDADLPVIMIAGHSDAALAVEAMRGGAYDVIEKPFSPEHLVEVVKRALEKRRLTLEVESLRRRLRHGDDIEARLIGGSPRMETIRRLILDVADADVDVLVIGETGTGKERVARCLHDFSRRQGENFVALNCGGLPDTLLDAELFGHAPGAFAGARKRRVGKIEYADNGTLFLEEVESMPVSVQMKLLRVLRERVIERPGSSEVVPVALRVVATSNVDLKTQGAEDGFSSDLYDRLNAVTIELPPLRERREDIPALYDHFLLMAAKRYGRPAPTVTPDEVRQLMAHDWPGNLRELRNHADCRALGIARGAGEADTGPQAGMTLSEAVETFERALITAELERQSGNVARSSEALGVARTTLHDKMRKYGLN